jgi:hypothetical protein
MVSLWDDLSENEGTLDVSMLRSDRIGSDAVGRWLNGDELGDDMFGDLASTYEGTK